VLATLLFATLKRRGAVSNAELDRIIAKLRKDNTDPAFLEKKPELIPVLHAE
jgi:hypothetical protein